MGPATTPKSSHQMPNKLAANRSPNEAKLYQKHMKFLKFALPKVDCSPPILNARNMLKVGKIMTDIEVHKRTYEHNIMLLRQLNAIEAQQDLQYARNPQTSRMNALFWKEVAARKRAVKLQKENIKFALRLLKIKNRNFDETRKKRIRSYECKIGKFKVPTHLMEKYRGKVIVPQDPCKQFKLFRPSIFIELQAKDECSLGRFEFQLYTEACPLVVLELVRFFMAENKSKMKLPRIYPKLWAETEMQIDKTKFAEVAQLEYDSRALDNASSCGIISVDLKSLNFMKMGALLLAISFKPLAVANSRRVAIGRITNGRRNLSEISGYGTKNGKPLKEIIVKQLGMINN